MSVLALKKTRQDMTLIIAKSLKKVKKNKEEENIVCLTDSTIQKYSTFKGEKRRGFIIKHLEGSHCQNCRV